MKKTALAASFAAVLLSVGPRAQAAAVPVCDVKAYGAKGDGTTKDTRAIQDAIDSCAQSGRAVVLHDGIFLSGMIRLRIGTHLTIAPSATLKGTQDDSDYPDLNAELLGLMPNGNSQFKNCHKALVYAGGGSDITIDGGGAIDGNGNVAKWLGPSKTNPESNRPMAIFIAHASAVMIRDISVRDAAMWAVVNMETDGLNIINVDVHSDLEGTRDGIDIVDCHSVTVAHCRVYSGDDSICLKSGSAHGVQGVTVRDSHVLHSTVANGLKLGTPSSGYFKNITFLNDTVEGVAQAAMAVETVGGGTIDNVVFQNIRFNAGAAVYLVEAQQTPSATPGRVNRVVFENITGVQTKSWGSAVSGTEINGATYRPSDITFRNFHVTSAVALASVPPDPAEFLLKQYPDPQLWGDLPASGLYLRHLQGVVFDDFTMPGAPGDKRDAVVKRDVLP